MDEAAKLSRFTTYLHAKANDWPTPYATDAEHAAACARAAAWLDRHEPFGLSIVFRPCTGGETPGTYGVPLDGSPRVQLDADTIPDRVLALVLHACQWSDATAPPRPEDAPQAAEAAAPDATPPPDADPAPAAAETPPAEPTDPAP